MNHGDEQQFEGLTDDQMLQIDRLCSRFEAALRTGNPLPAEVLLKELPLNLRRAALTELLSVEIQYRLRDGRPLTLEELTTRFPKVNAGWLEKQWKAASKETEFSAVSDPVPGVAVPDSLGDYRILSRLGSGGMGTVYRAEHRRMGRQVALKVLRPEIQDNPELLQRFDREVRAAARLSHPNIVAALDARESDGQHFLVTELVEGADLEETVRQNGPLSVELALQSVLQAARGLAYAHSRGVIHRDIKPANLLLAHDGTVKILDMGLARLDAHDEPASTQLTKTGVIMGTAAYMPPEQARDTRRADARSDIYSLGCTLFFLLTGRTAFSGTSQMDMILSHVSQPIPSLKQANSKVPVELDAVFQQMVAKEPGHRIQSAADLVGELERIVANMQDGNIQRTMVEDSSDLPDIHGDSLTTPVDIKWPPLANVEQADVWPATAFQAHVDAADLKRQPPTARRYRAGNPVWIAGAALAMTAVAAIAFVLNQGNEVSDSTVDTGHGSAQNTGGSFVDAEDSQEDSSPEAVPRNDAARYALRFNGSSSFASVPELVPKAGQTYTLEAVIQPEYFRLSDILAWMGPDWMALYLDETGHIGAARRVGDRSQLVKATESISLNQWLHVAAAFEEDRMFVFVNGRQMATTAETFHLPETTGGLFIGGFDSSRVPSEQADRFYAGQIAGVRISVGVRYENDFAAPARLTPDDDTLAAFMLNDGPESRSIGHGIDGRTWNIQTSGAVWEPLSPLPDSP